MPELKEVTFKIHSPSDTTNEKTYTMKEMIGEEDLAFQHQFTEPLTGKVQIRDLWFKRISRTLVPAISENDLKQLPAWEINSLIRQWMIMNEGVTASFL